IVIVERTDAAKRAIVPNYVTESAYVEDIPARTMVGDDQEKRTLVVMNVGTGKSVTAEAPREARWGMPLLSGDGSLAVANARAVENKDRWLLAVDPDTGATRVIDALHDDAWIREVGGFGSAGASFGWLPDQKHLWFLSERDGWMHLYSVDASAAPAEPRQ